MKKLITNYQFNPINGEITFVDYTSISLSSVLLITNTTDNIIIYNFTSPSLGGTISSNVLNLAYDTSAMSDTDALQIYYDAPEINAATDESLAALQEQNILLRRLLKISESLSIVDTNQRQRVSLDAAPATITINANNTQMKPVDNNNLPLYNINANTLSATATYATIPEFWKFVDAARLNYQQAIRSNLSFS